MNSEFESAADLLENGLGRSGPARSGDRRFGLYEEGEGVLSLYLSPMHLPVLLSGLNPWVKNRVVAILGATPRPPKGIPLGDGGVIASADALLDLSAPAEAVVFRNTPTPQEINSQLPSSLLACPQGSLPANLNAEFALILPDDHHVIVLTRDRSLLLHLLSRFLNRKHSNSFPRIEGLAEEEILESIAPWTWRQVRLTEVDGVQQLAIDTMNPEHEGEYRQQLRWVAPKTGGYWRSGWTW